MDDDLDGGRSNNDRGGGGNGGGDDDDDKEEEDEKEAAMVVVVMMIKLFKGLRPPKFRAISTRRLLPGVQISTVKSPMESHFSSHLPYLVVLYLLCDIATVYFVKQVDLGYLLKLGGGSLLGAAAIKYGSALVPVITKPNILQALTMIFAPVIVAVLLLIKKSSVE
ncbi:hypothetical protein LguiB_023138 [Lonicera macranthoides]